MSLIVELAGTLIAAIIGFVIILRTILVNRFQKDLWKVFSMVARTLGLKVKHSSTISSNYPDIYGQVDGRKIYLHPAKKKRGRGSRPAKTIYGVEHGIRVDEPIIITRTGTDTGKDELMSLDVDDLKKYKLKTESESKLNEGLANDMVESGVARDINELIENNEDNFRALIIESGLLMFSTFGFQEDEDKINESIEKLYEITTGMEDNLSEVEDIYNERFNQLDKRNYAVPMKYGIDISLAAIGIIMIYSSLSDMDFLFINIGVVILLVAAVRIYSLTSLVFQGRS